jgi:hypothetical protein
MVANIEKPLFRSGGPDHRIHALNNARGVPNGKRRAFSMNDTESWRELLARVAVHWRNPPTRASA